MFEIIINLIVNSMTIKQHILIKHILRLMLYDFRPALNPIAQFNVAISEPHGANRSIWITLSIIVFICVPLPRIYSRVLLVPHVRFNGHI